MSTDIPFVTDTELDETISQSSLPVFVVFSNPESSVSKTIAPALDNLAIKYRDQVKFIGLNLDDYPSVTARYGITMRERPNYQTFKEGLFVCGVAGPAPASKIEDLITKALQP